VAAWEKDLVKSPRSLQYVPPPRHKIEFRVGQGVGDLGRYLFEPNVPWEIRQPTAITNPDWELVSRATFIFSWSTHSPYDFIIRIHHLFIELALPVLLLSHVASGTYADRSAFAQQLQAGLVQRGRTGRWQDHEIEDLLDKSGSSSAFVRDPSVILNRLRIIRNNVIHADPSVAATGGVEHWGGVYLRYFEALLEELLLVSVG